jgi:hypothetical protein
MARVRRRGPADLLRLWRNRHVKGDEFRISAVCFLLDDSLSDWMTAKGFRRGRSRYPVSYSFPSVAFVANDGDERQRLFEETLEGFRNRLLESGIDEEFVRVHDASVKVYTSLSPTIGFADLFLFPATLELWRPLNAAFHFDVIAADMKRARKRDLTIE